MYGGNSSIELSTDEDENRSQEELKKIYKEQMRYEGFTRSLISMQKILITNTQKMYQELGEKKIDASVIWGDEDDCALDGFII